MQTLATIQAQYNEGRHHGPSYGWSDLSTTSAGMTIGANPAIVTWTVTFSDREQPLATHTRVEIRRIATYYYSKTQAQWVALYDDVPYGGYDHPESDFASHSAHSAEVDGNYFVSPPADTCTELWGARCSIPEDTDDIGAFFGCVEHRLVSTDGSDLYELPQAQWLMQCGMDYWSALTGGSNTGIGQGRIVRVLPEWRCSFYWTTDGTVSTDLATTLSNIIGR